MIALETSTLSGCAVSDNSYAGLCSFACGQGYCPENLCTQVASSTECPIVVSQEGRAERLRRLNSLYKGIYWDAAYPDGDPGDCTSEELSILGEATRVGVYMAADNGQEDTPFDRYFVQDSYVQFGWSLYYGAQFAQLISKSIL